MLRVLWEPRGRILDAGWHRGREKGRRVLVGEGWEGRFRQREQYELRSSMSRSQSSKHLCGGRRRAREELEKGNEDEVRCRGSQILGISLGCRYIPRHQDETWKAP